MRCFLSLLFLSLLSLEAAERKKPSTISIRLHAEGNPRDGETFVVPVTLTNPPKQTVIRKVPLISERDIVEFYPFAAVDGTIGCYFKLDASGTNKLLQHTTEFRDTLVVALINGRVACAMMVGMNGGAVWALPEVRSTAKAYSFQAKIRQKMAVAAMPVAACGRTTFTNACRRV